MDRTKTYKLLLASLLTTIMQFCFAQDKLDFNIVSFDEDPHSTTAMEKGFEDWDDDNYRFAIIKVKDVDGNGDLDGFTFDFGGPASKLKKHDDELWVYVQRNAKTVTIKRPGYKTIERYDLEKTIQAGRVYVMRISMSNVEKVVKHNITKQGLQFIITPSNENATVKVKKADSTSDYVTWDDDDAIGSADNKLMDFGTYDYIVSAENYIESRGRVTLSDSKHTYVEKVILRPNFGFLVVDDAYGISGAKIFVDDIKVGTVPYHDTNKRWSCGEHKITITNGDLYKPFNSTFTIHQGDTTRLSPKLDSDFAQTTIRVNADAEIFIDDISKGRKTWTGPLKAGKYVVECKQDRHRSTSISINVKADKAETFEVPAPIAITGSLYVSSTPSGATIEIDGKEVGTTPQLVQDVLIGNHEVSLIRQNYKRETISVTIKENQTENLSQKLKDIAQMTIDSKPTGARLFINGEDVGTTPYTKEMSSGDYMLELHMNKYKTFKESVHLDGSHPHKDITLEQQYQRPYSFYIQPFLQVGSNMSVGGAIGGYISNINIEGYYAVGMKESEEIWWNPTSTESNERPFSYTYKSTLMGVRLGYGIIYGTKLRITPQAGLNIVSFKGTGEHGISNGYVSSLFVGCKADYALLSFLNVSIVPGYDVTVTKSENFVQLSAISSVIKGWVSGFNCRIGMAINF